MRPGCRHRHTVVAPSHLDAFTYLFAQPIALHTADGWRLTGETGTGAFPDNTWHKLVRPADA